MRRLHPALLSLLTLFSGCSPGYVLRAGWEEAGILWRKQPIDRVVQDPSIDAEVRRKLELVLEAREFAKKIGLTPDGSYTEYTAVDRDILVYVVTAAPKRELRPYTWWFPVVGSVPYKGYFELPDARREADKLEQRGFDVSIRGSAAFSTLGWFDDPLLSTVVRNDDLAVIDTVLHEMLHQTIWIGGHVPFNESLANFVGSRASTAFFRERFGPEDPRVIEGERRWQDELRFAQLLSELVIQLEALFAQNMPEEETLRRKGDLIAATADRWRKDAVAAKSDAYTKVVSALNNASILGLKTYLTEPGLFQKLFEVARGDFPEFLGKLRELRDDASSEDPFQKLRRRVGE